MQADFNSANTSELDLGPHRKALSYLIGCRGVGGEWSRESRGRGFA
jgi:hypothetical protein